MNYPRRELVFFSILIFALIALRLFTLGSLALADPSEGRYASMAQVMYLAGNWITPMTYKEGVLTPFLGKPPLHAWLTALSFMSFGMSEFSARLPSFLSALMMCGCTALFARRFFSTEIALASIFILLSSTVFFFMTGACLTDPVLAAALTAAFVSFAFAVHGSNKQRELFGLLLFAALACGFLTKGPVALAIVAAGVGPWLILTRRVKQVLALPLVRGAALFLILAAPWFIVAEYASPGFLRYFFVNENFLRFVVSDYGDKYGSGHPHFFGYIWLMAALGMLPWSFILPLALCRGRKTFEAVRDDQLLLYCVLWAVAPCIFFTFARQTSFSYVLPGVCGAAVAFAKLLHEVLLEGARARRIQRRTVLAASGLLMLFLFAANLKTDARPLYLLWLVVAGALLCAIWSRRPRRISALAGTSLTATCVVVLFSLATIGLSNAIDLQVSSKQIVRDLESRMSDNGKAAFLIKVPYSAYFYLADEPGDRHKVELLTGNHAPSTDFVIAKAAGAEFSVSSTLASFSLVKEAGKWILLEKRERLPAPTVLPVRTPG